MLDYETKSVYSVIVLVRDGRDSEGAADTVTDDTINVTVSVTNVDEPGILVLSSPQPSLNVPLTAELTDPDQNVEALIWTWERSSDQMRTWETIRGATSSNYEPVEDDVDNHLRVAVAYRDGHGSGKSVMTPLVNPVLGEEEPTPASEVFEDIRAGIWYEPAVTWMIYYRITSGCTVTLFCPERNLTRQEFVTFLWRAADRTGPPNTGSEAFSDVTEGGYADEAIGWAVANGVTAGCTQGEFGDPTWQFCPEQHITRGQMATFLYRHVGADYVGPIPSFTDVNPDRYFATSVAWLTGSQVAPGCGSNLFCPQRNATRAEAALFIHGVATRPHIWGAGNTSFNPQPN